MNLSEMSAQAATAAQRFRTNTAIQGNWLAAGDMISKLAVNKNVSGNIESFIENSEVFRELLKSINAEEVSVPDLILLAQTAKAIEDGDTKAATFVRDTSGGKPADKIELPKSNLTSLSDKQLQFLLDHAEELEDE